MLYVLCGLLFSLALRQSACLSEQATSPLGCLLAARSPVPAGGSSALTLGDRSRSHGRLTANIHKHNRHPCPSQYLTVEGRWAGHRTLEASGDRGDGWLGHSRRNERRKRVPYLRGSCNCASWLWGEKEPMGDRDRGGLPRHDQRKVPRR